MPLLGLAAVIAAAGIAAIGWLARPLRRDPRRVAELSDAVAAVDRELAANLELMSMFDQTRQAVVLENAEFTHYRATLEREARDTAGQLAALYDRLAEAESAMERRGPANSIRDEDRRLIEGWEGDARQAQTALQKAVDTDLVGWTAVTARLYGR
jgi:DNA anti-recombination protein RmuC